MSTTDQDSNGEDGLAQGPDGDKPMAFLDHVGELRARLVRIVLGIFLGFFACFYFAPQISAFLRLPLDNAWESAGMADEAKLQALAIQDPLMVDVRVAVTAAIFLTLPWIFFQVWLFVAPGLYAKEKKFVIPFVAVSVIMFLIGSAFAFMVVLPFVYEWMMEYSTGRGEEIQLELNNYFKGTTRVLLAFGLVFEFPLAVAFLAKAGVVTEKVLVRFWKVAVVVMFVLAAFLTPPEPVSQMLMAGPMVVLYFISIGVAWVINPSSKVEAELAVYDEADEDDEDGDGDGDADDSE
ncbi:Sec-independent protein translocase TatC [Plesiocystis pacifica SIR-1]|uniref:Sec-independent protein translocase protein TatC n=1 Tax=Plesiocystis pacifica SIR-1 TaxID=391625 RepID=A6G5P8_9BACT|nr:twin-arginine translocase subunit TatC [Plesiocystis pacifica]EDM78829.1 Sec-independent protein translocase TatC [Plesiocystis pacifica SIR-1]